jgi:endoglucanase
MDAQAENGIPNLSCMPNNSTGRAWRSIAPSFVHDSGVIFEPFNEPCKYEGDPKNKTEWAQTMQPVIDELRGLGATNILLLDGLGYGHSIEGLFPLVHDRLRNRLAMAVHPYLVKINYVTVDQWRKEFGNDTERYPTIAGEWNATSTNGCIDSTTPELALSLMRYLESLHIGLIGWGIDSNYGKLVKDHSEYEPTDYASFSGCTKIPSESGGGRLLTNYPND